MTSNSNQEKITHLIVITGASKGLGRALAQASFNEHALVVTVARTAILEFKEINPDSIKKIHFAADLSCSKSTTTLIEQLENLIKQTPTLDSLTLINNAGTVEPMGLLNEQLDDSQFSQAFELNVVSPIRLSKWVIGLQGISDNQKKILNISSGAGRKAVAGWGIYCATKAALDRFSEVVAFERPDILVSSLAPGVIDTQMQKTIRETPEAQFPTLQRFTELHSRGELAHADDTAKAIIKFLSSPDFGKNVIDDIRLHSL